MKFTIRDILWPTVVAAIGVTCCLEREKRIAAMVTAKENVALLKEKITALEQSDQRVLSLEREIRLLNYKLADWRDERNKLRLNNDRMRVQLAKEVAERLRLVREVGQLTSLIDKTESQPSIGPIEVR
jgi:regulator of replication initiation timing